MSPRTLSLLLALTLPALAEPSHPPRTLADLRDRSRPLLIFSSEKDSRLNEQLNLLTPHRADLLDRQIMLVPFAHAWAGAIDPALVTLMHDDEPALRHRFHIAPGDFTVILLGKDGGEKFRAHTPVTMNQLRHLIDAMPMRQSEMRARPKH